MSDLNLNSTKGIIYIVLIIVACLVGLWGLNKLSNMYSSSKRTRIEVLNDTASKMSKGGRPRKHKRQRK